MVFRKVTSVATIMLSEDSDQFAVIGPAAGTNRSAIAKYPLRPVGTRPPARNVYPTGPVNFGGELALIPMKVNAQSPGYSEVAVTVSEVDPPAPE